MEIKKNELKLAKTRAIEQQRIEQLSCKRREEFVIFKCNKWKLGLYMIRLWAEREVKKKGKNKTCKLNESWHSYK